MVTSDRLPVVVSLLLGIAIVSVLFLRQRDSSPVPASGAESAAEAAARAHEAAGVEVGGGPQAVGPVVPGFEARLDDARAVLAAAPDDVDQILVLARLLHDGHRPDEAVALYRRALALEPGRVEATYDLAAALAVAGEWQAATGVLERRVGEAPDDYVALYDLGAIRANAGDREGALRWFERALSMTDDAEVRQRAQAAIDRLSGRTP